MLLQLVGAINFEYGNFKNCNFNTNLILKISRSLILKTISNLASKTVISKYDVN